MAKQNISNPGATDSPGSIAQSMTPLLRVFFRLGWEVNERAEDLHSICERRKKVNGTEVLSENAKTGQSGKIEPLNNAGDTVRRAQTFASSEGNVHHTQRTFHFAPVPVKVNPQGLLEGLHERRDKKLRQTGGSTTQTATFGLSCDPMGKIGVPVLFFAGFYIHQLVLGI